MTEWTNVTKRPERASCSAPAMRMSRARSKTVRSHDRIPEPDHALCLLCEWWHSEPPELGRSAIHFYSSQ